MRRGPVPRNIHEEATTLNLDGNSIAVLYNDSFDYLAFLEKLSINHNDITYIARYALWKNTRLYSLKIRGHKLSAFPTHLGGASARIMVLDTRGATDMASFQLGNFPRLYHAVMNSNNISNGNLIMKHLPALQYLYVSSCNLHVFPDLSAAPVLEVVQLHYNNFKTIPTFSLRNLSRLRKFACMNCNIRYLPDMSHLVALETLVIADNALTAIPDLFYLPLTDLYWAGNPMECNESLCWVRMWNDVNPRVLELDPSGSLMTCASPVEVTGLHLADIHPVAMKCYEGDSRTTGDSWWLHILVT